MTPCRLGTTSWRSRRRCRRSRSRPLYRTPSLTVKGKSIARLRTEAEGRLVLMCSLHEKQALLASGDPAFSTTPHYDGYGSVLVDLEKIGRDQLAELVTDA